MTTISKKNIFKTSLAAAAFCLLVSQTGFAQKKKIVPKETGSEIVIKGNKSNSYFTVSQNKPSTITVDGPGKLTVHTRVVLKEGATHSDPLILKYVQDDKKQKVKTIRGLDKAPNFLSETKPVTIAQSEIIKVLPGKHTYRFYKKDTKEEVCLNFVYKKDPDPVWEDITPAAKL